MTELIRSDLPELALAINRAQQSIESAISQALGHAIEAGQALIDAKALVKHGEWQTWLKGNCTVSDRTARNYMRLAREMPKLSPQERQRVADLPLREAVAAIATPKANHPPFDVMLSILKVDCEKWLVCKDTSDSFLSYSLIIPRRQKKKDLYQIVHIFLDGHDAYIEAIKPCYAFGVPMVLHHMGVSVDPKSWGVIDRVDEVEEELAA